MASVAVQAGDEISFSGPRSGCRAYSCWQVALMPVVMGIPLICAVKQAAGGRALAAGDVLSAG